MSLAAVIERSKQDREGWKYTSLAPLAAQKFTRAPASISVLPTAFPIPFLIGVVLASQLPLSHHLA